MRLTIIMMTQRPQSSESDVRNLQQGKIKICATATEWYIIGQEKERGDAGVRVLHVRVRAQNKQCINWITSVC